MLAKRVGSGGASGAACSAGAGAPMAGGRAASEACGPERAGAWAAGSVAATTSGFSARTGDATRTAANAAHNATTERIALKTPVSQLGSMPPYYLVNDAESLTAVLL